VAFPFRKTAFELVARVILLLKIFKLFNNEGVALEHNPAAIYQFPPLLYMEALFIDILYNGFQII